MVGRTPWSAADALVGLLAPCKTLLSLFRPRDGGVPRGPGGPPHHQCRLGDEARQQKNAVSENPSMVNPKPQ
jgi:hypothetical protein